MFARWDRNSFDSLRRPQIEETTGSHGKADLTLSMKDVDQCSKYGPHVSTIDITEFDYDTMLRVTEYIYTDKPKLDWLCAVDVLRAADIYGIDRLKQMCEDVIIQGLEMENVCYLMELADFHSAEQLARACIDYICGQHAGNFAQIAAYAPFEKLFACFPHYRERVEAACGPVQVVTARDTKQKSCQSSLHSASSSSGGSSSDYMAVDG